ncbi:uncharacterized protein Eint_111790 [Encephalitozoon intestinalis ATCC 50506]|uniref:Uncharacterized protein n=1 Tax=Encephalitozoon intestinalis (strain ATCC 50506) TaxID=876142 RepID=E0SA56_ENCIT|nr:uncharacterized protein Eint_111790 [Encephalitozoon intestinalis ATCC 50506]ADM12678.1 hypothetical protein Eint_111790 [Encephalitozoon intestinalis ATCC 50506]UTX46539.1 hypothetical protein GPK93_11g21510 [Encephalitozoon intestinalis]
MEKKVKAGLVNSVLISIIIILGIIITHLSFYNSLRDMIFKNPENIILMNKRDIEKNIYGDRMKIQIPPESLSEEMWAGFESLCTNAIIIVSQGDYVKVFNIISRKMNQYKHNEYIKHLESIGNYLFFLNNSNYSIRNFLRDSLGYDGRNVIEDSPMIYGCLILPNTDGGLKFMSKSKIMDVNCNWENIMGYIYLDQNM